MENVKVPKDAVLGEIGKGYKIAIETLNEGRIGIASQMLGLAQGALDGAMKYAGEREQFGKALKGFQGVQFQLAQMEVSIETARLAVYNAARLKDAGKPFVKEAAIAKYWASDIAEKLLSQALEIYGGYGFIKEFPAEKFYRDAKIGKLYEGTSNMQLQTIFKLMEAQYFKTIYLQLLAAGFLLSSSDSFSQTVFSRHDLQKKNTAIYLPNDQPRRSTETPVADRCLRYSNSGKDRQEQE